MKKNNKKQNKKAPIIRETPWLTTTERFVGFVDIMGFKDMLTKIPHEKVYSLMKNVSHSVNSIQSIFAVDFESDNDSDTNIKMILFSDSIMIFTRDNQAHSLENLTGSMSTLSEFLFSDEIPHKGAIAYGRMTLDFEKSIFFGQPLVDAYLLQEELKFYGIVVHGTAEITGDIFDGESTIEYNCPFKTGTAKHLTIAPCISLTVEFESKDIDVVRENVLKLRERTSGPLRKYIDNTTDYLDFVKIRGEEIFKEQIKKEKENK